MIVLRNCTYNYPQERLTDHRINFTSHNLSAILNGDMDDLLNELVQADRIQRLQENKGLSPYFYLKNSKNKLFNHTLT